MRNLHIGTRLRLAFACVVLLMFVGSGISVWYLHDLRKQVESVSLVEERMIAVLRIDNAVLSLMNQLHRVADVQKRDLFEAEATRLMGILQSETASATGIIQSMSPENQRQRVILDSLNTMLQTLPERVHSFMELARAEDWVALHARLRNQVDRTDDVVAALVSDVQSDLASSRTRLAGEVKRAERRTLGILAATGISCLLLAGLLGVVVTRSIARPLVSLEEGTRTLSEGRLGIQIDVNGEDELAHLATAFNRTSRDLEDLYAKVQESEAHFRSLIENASDLIMTVSPTGEILYASPSNAGVFGLSIETLQGLSIRDLVAQDDLPLVDSILGDQSQSHACKGFEMRVRHQSGDFRILEGVATNLLVDPNVRGIVVNARDVTERRAAELILREREDQLQQAQKLEAIGLLAGGVAHDFNNLLTVINGYSEFLMGATDPADSRHGYAKSIHQAGKRAADLTRQLLAFGRKQLLRPAVLNMNEIVDEVARLVRRVIGEDIDLACKLDPAVGGVEADRNQIHQVLMNLVANARDAMPQGGQLAMETFNITLEKPLTSRETEIPPGPYVRLTVSDTGSGMDETTQRRIFEPFYTTKEQGKGTGLGLASVYGIVRQSGGHIIVESAIGKGTAFRIFFPRVDRAADPAQEPEFVKPLDATETILVVEDEPEVRLIASKSLKDCGYQVIEAADGQQALDLFRASAVRIHLLLTDVVMPGMTGVELSRNLLALDSNLKMIYVSGYADSMLLRQGGMVAGAKFLQKPYRPAELAAKVREALGGLNEKA